MIPHLLLLFLIFILVFCFSFSFLFMTTTNRSVVESIKAIVETIIWCWLGFLVGSIVATLIGFFLASLFVLYVLIWLTPNEFLFSTYLLVLWLIPLGGIVGGVLLFPLPIKWKRIVISLGVIVTLDLACLLSIFFLGPYSDYSKYIALIPT